MTKISAATDTTTLPLTAIYPVALAGDNTARHITHATLRGGVFNVKDYGAVGDGVMDDTAAIQSTLTAAGAANAGIFLPPGTYLITAPLQILNSQRMTGVSKEGSVIKATTAITMLQSVSVIGGGSTSKIYLENFTLNGSGVAAQGIIIGHDSSALSFRNNISDVDVLNCNNGITLNTCVYSTMKNVFVSGNNVIGSTGLSFGGTYGAQSCQLTNAVATLFAINFNIIGTGIAATGCASYAEASATNTVNLVRLTNAYLNSFRNCIFENISGLNISEVLIVELTGAVFHSNSNHFLNCNWNGTVPTVTCTHLELGLAGNPVVSGTVLQGCVFSKATVDKTCILYSNSQNTVLMFTYAIVGYSGNEIDLPSESGVDGGYPVAIGHAQQVLATGAAHTVDDVITALQNLGLVKQA